MPPRPDIPEEENDPIYNIEDPRDGDYVDLENDLNDPSVVETTPSSRIVTLASPSLETKRRVLRFDPNHGRCLIENCSDARALEYCHCVAKNFTLKTELMSNIEWYWNMKYYSLNLNSSHNIFCAGVALHRLFDRDRYLLVPEDRIIDQYHNTLTYSNLKWVAKRKLFPVIPNREDYKYTLIPLARMTEVAIHRQDRTLPSGTALAPTHFTTYVFPFTDLPQLTSHLHPRFVILEAGRKLQSSTASADVVTGYPILAKVTHLYSAWTRAPPPEAKDDESYDRPGGGDDDDDNNSKRDNRDETATDGGRLRNGKMYKRGGGGGSPTPGASGSKRGKGTSLGKPGNKRTAQGEPVSRQRRNSICLSEKTLVEHERVFGKGKKWSSAAVQVWFKEVLEQAPPPQISVE